MIALWFSTSSTGRLAGMNRFKSSQGSTLVQLPQSKKQTGIGGLGELLIADSKLQIVVNESVCVCFSGMTGDLFRV